MRSLRLLRALVPALALSLSIPTALTGLSACGGSQVKDKGKTGKNGKKPKTTAKALFAEGMDAEAQGQPAVAEDKYARALRLKPGFFEAAQALTELLINDKRPGEAVTVAAAFHDKEPGDLQGYRLLAKAQIAAGSYADAGAVLGELLELDDQDAAAFDMRARVLVELGKFDEAIADMRKAVEMQPQNADYMVSLGSALERANNENEARVYYNSALQVDENHARAHRLLGILLRKEFSLQDALMHHQKAASVEPDNGRNWFELGLTQNAGGDNLGAEESLKKATDLDGEDATTWYAYGEVERNLKKYKEAIAAYKKCLALPNPHPKAASKLGLVLFYDGQYADAEVFLTDLVRKDGKNAQALFNLGFVYGEQGKYKLAVEAYEQFIKVADAGDGDIPVAKKKIKELKAKGKIR